MARKNKTQKLIAHNQAVLNSLKPPTKRFTKLQLLSLTDGRLSTNMGDIYKMLNHIYQDNLTTLALVLTYNQILLPA